MMSVPVIKNPSPGHPSALPAGEIREQLLDAATSLFAERGIAGTTVAQIAAHVGVTSAMVHYYFETRDHLLDTIIEERIERFIAYVWDPIDVNEADPFTMVKDLVIRIIKASDLMPWLPPLWIREIVNEGGLLREKMLQRIPVEKPMQFGKSIAAGQKQGIVNPDIDPRWLFMSIIGLTMLPLAAAKIWNRVPALAGLNKDDLARHVIALLMNGLTSPSFDPASGTD
jgi:AcrR family transcriptional regulator